MNPFDAGIFRPRGDSKRAVAAFFSLTFAGSNPSSSANLSMMRSMKKAASGRPAPL